MSQFQLDRQGLIAAFLAAATWAMSGVFVRWLSDWSPFAILAGRFFLATIAMLPLLFLSSLRQDITRSLAMPLIWWLSLPTIAGYVFGTTAFQIAPVGEVTLLFTTSPLFIIIYNYIVHLPVRANERLGMILAIAGVILILFPQLSLQTVYWQTLAGYLSALAAAASIALYTVWFNSLSRRNIAPRSIGIVFCTCLLGTLLSSFFAVFFPLPPTIGVDQQAILILWGLGILSTAFPFFCYTIAAQRLPVLLTTAILLLEPLFAALFASIALHEMPSLWFILGSMLVISGLLSIAKVT